MDIQKIDSPWEHWIVDSFLLPDEHALLLSWFRDQPSKTKGEKTHADGLGVSYEPHIERILEESFLELLSYTGFNGRGVMTYELHKMLPDESFDNPHCDTKSKLASLVLYVGAPNKGTFIHESKDSEGVEVEWKQNRALLFFPKQGVTWHSYNNYNTNTDRCTALLNIRG